MAIQSAAAVALSFRRETTYGTLATNDATARHVPYVSHSLALSKSTINSEEIRPDMQVATMRHGNRAIGGDLQAHLQTGTYSPLMESALRRDFTAVTNIGPLTTISASSAGPHFTRASGSFITDGLRVGMCIRMTGWTTTGVPNNSVNYTILGLSATQITVAELVGTKAAGDSITISVPGRITWMPVSSPTQHGYSFEEWSPDVPNSFRFTGCRVNSMALDLKPNAAAGLTFGLMGRDRAQAAGRYFSAGVTPTSGPMQVGHNGLLVVNGAASGVVTGLQINIDHGMQTAAVVGSNLTPNVFHGPMKVSGSMSVFFETSVIDALFDAESELSLISRVADDTSAASGFLQICLPRIKLAGGSYSSDSASRVQSFEFSALLHTGSSGNENTTMILQDSSLP